MDSQDQFIQIEIKDRIGHILLNRPHVLNALNRSMVKKIVSTLETFDQDEDIRVIVISGKGRSFAAGADIEEMVDETSVQIELINPFADWDRISLIKKPIIAAVHGYVLGGGFELALSCDLLFASENTKFGFPEVNLGVMPGAGGTQRLTKILGKYQALEWLWSGEYIDAKEALKRGLINQVFPQETFLEETFEFAKKIAEKPPLSIRLIKEAVHKAIDYPLYEGMQFERKNFYLLFSSMDQKEGMKAFIEKRKPNFKGK